MQTNDPLSEYIAYLHLKALSKGTIEGYRYALEALFRFLGLEPTHVAALGTGRIRAYVANLQQRGLADSTVARYLQRAGLGKGATPHTLRHSAAVHYLTAGAPISFVQDLLGHASLATTGIYTQLADEMMKEAMNAIAEEKGIKEEMVRYVGRGLEAEARVWHVVGS